ncbi:hypothetical protein AVEN_201715-1, partial [Araneus ventricosus]
MYDDTVRPKTEDLMFASPHNLDLQWNWVSYLGPSAETQQLVYRVL